MVFYERVNWIGVSDFLSAYFGEGGILIAGLFKLVSILIISPLICLFPFFFFKFVLERKIQIIFQTMKKPHGAGTHKGA